MSNLTQAFVGSFFPWQQNGNKESSARCYHLVGEQVLDTGLGETGLLSPHTIMSVFQVLRVSDLWHSPPQQVLMLK